MNFARSLTRRDALRISAATLAAGLASPRPARARDFTGIVPEARGLTVYSRNQQVLVRLDNQPVLGYRAQSDLKYPYFAPLAGPVSGASLLTESALPYPHHRGLWVGCEPLAGADFWSDQPLERGQILSKGLEASRVDERTASLKDHCHWHVPGQEPILEDRREFHFHLVDERTRTLRVELHLKARRDLEVTSAKHSFFALRVASELAPAYGGVLENSEGGTGAKGTYGKEARWCGYHGKRAHCPDVVEGIQIMTHPENPWRPVWFTREYGHLSPSPLYFLEGKPWRLEKGATLHLRYQVVAHAGRPDHRRLEGLYREWTEGS